MITANAIKRTFYLKIGNSIATGFVIDIDNRQYLITAKHFAGAIQDKELIGIYQDKQWKPVEATVVGHGHNDIDISVLTIPQILVRPNLTLPATQDGLTYGQQVYFLGFPYGLFGDVGDLTNDFPLPFVKGGILSCFANDPNGDDILALDAINNQGFSGGPVIFKPQGSSVFQVASVISAYRTNKSPVIFKENQELPDLSVRENSGLVISYPIRYAIELIKKNPIGIPNIAMPEF